MILSSRATRAKRRSRTAPSPPFSRRTAPTGPVTSVSITAWARTGTPSPRTSPSRCARSPPTNAHRSAPGWAVVASPLSSSPGKENSRNLGRWPVRHSAAGRIPATPGDQPTQCVLHAIFGSGSTRIGAALPGRRLAWPLPRRKESPRPLPSHAKGCKDPAQQWLEKTYQDGDSTMVYMKVDPSFDTLRDERRFQTLLRKMNFPP